MDVDACACYEFIVVYNTCGLVLSPSLSAGRNRLNDQSTGPWSASNERRETTALMMKSMLPPPPPLLLLLLLVPSMMMMMMIMTARRHAPCRLVQHDTPSTSTSVTPCHVRSAS